jgi:hypothetical protein
MSSTISTSQGGVGHRGSAFGLGAGRWAFRVRMQRLIRAARRVFCLNNPGRNTGRRKSGSRLRPPANSAMMHNAAAASREGMMMNH